MRPRAHGFSQPAQPVEAELAAHAVLAVLASAARLRRPISGRAFLRGAQQAGSSMDSIAHRPASCAQRNSTAQYDALFAVVRLGAAVHGARPAVRARRAGQLAELSPPSPRLSQPDSTSVPLQTDEQIKTAIKDAEESCEGDNKGECAAAWDTVEELSAAASHKKSVRLAVVPPVACRDLLERRTRVQNSRWSACSLPVMRVVLYANVLSFSVAAIAQWPLLPSRWVILACVAQYAAGFALLHYNASAQNRPVGRRRPAREVL